MPTKSAFLVIFQATINNQLAETEVSTIKNPMNSRQVRRDCEAVARASFGELAAATGNVFASTDKIKCVECLEVREGDESNGKM